MATVRLRRIPKTFKVNAGAQIAIAYYNIGSDPTDTYTVTVGSGTGDNYGDTSWSSTANSVTITDNGTTVKIKANSGNIYITSITVTYPTA